MHVFYYPNLVEIHSLGLLLPGITVEQMESGGVQSKLRNSVLAGLLSNVPGYIEQIGSGVRFMLDETKRMGLPGPQFRERSEFVVMFHKAPALLPLQTRVQYQEKTLWEDDEKPQHEIVIHNAQVEKRESRLVEAVNIVHEYGYITNGMYRQLTGVTERTAHRDLETLVERGRLKGMGQRAARK